MKPSKGIIHRWALICCIPLAVVVAWAGSNYYKSSVSLDLYETLGSEYNQLDKEYAENYPDGDRIIWDDEIALPDAEGWETLPDTVDRPTEQEAAELALLEKMFEKNHQRDEALKKQNHYNHETVDAYQMAFYLFLAIAIPYLIWPLVIAARWVWRGGAPAGEVSQRLAVLKKLHTEGLISDEEYDAQRQYVIRDI